MTVIKTRQSVFDLATQINGDVKSAVDIALKNGFSFTQDLEAGSVYKETETIYKNELISDFFSAKNTELTTGTPKTIQDLKGIGKMTINSDFIIE